MTNLSAENDIEAWKLKPESAAILRHIIDTIFIIVLAAIIVLIAWSVGADYWWAVIAWIARLDYTYIAFTVIIISMVLGWSVPNKLMAAIRSLRLWPRHWGLAVRGFLGVLLTLGLACWTELLEVNSRTFVALIFGAIGVEGLVMFVGSTVAKVHLWLCENLNHNERNPKTDDSPIYKLEENLFPEHEVAARRILGWLESGKDTSKKGPNVAVIGPYGSGKTSLCNLVEDISKKERNQRSNGALEFCRFEAWAFLTADGAVRGLLDQIVRKVEELVDCSGLGVVPEEYIEALKASPDKWFGMIAAVLRRRQNPEEIIRSIQNVLSRLGKRIVVFVDDFDRLENKSKETQQAIAAALNQLQNLTTVQYVLCVGPMRHGVGSDLLKLTRFQELMPEVSGEEVIKRIRLLRDEAIRSEQTMYYPWDLMKEGDDDPLQYYPHREELSTTFVHKLVKLIEKPRQLKAIERETREKWNGGLKGEVSWYDFLIMSVLKVSEPAVFEWIIREPKVFLEEEIHITEPADEEKKEARRVIKEQLKELIEIKTETRLKIVQQVLLDLFPNFMRRFAQQMNRREPQPWEQSIAWEPMFGISYFRRCVSGCVLGTEVPDQPTLQYIRDINRKGFEKKDFEQRYLCSYQKLTNDLNRFVQFSKLLSRKLAMEVCDCMLEWICDRQHWKVWDREEEYISAMMGDIKNIIENAGQFEFAQASRKFRQDTEDATESKEKEEVKKRIERLLSKDVIVAMTYADYVAEYILGKTEAKTLLATAFREKFLINKEAIWEAAKGHRVYFSWIISVLKYNKDYESIREQVTKSVAEGVEADESGEFVESVVISLVRYQYPAGKPDLIEGYEFHVEKEKNRKTYDMDVLLPLIARWKGRKFKDPVSAKAYEILLKEYAEELKVTEGQVNTME